MDGWSQRSEATRLLRGWVAPQDAPREAQGRHRQHWGPPLEALSWGIWRSLAASATATAQPAALPFIVEKPQQQLHQAVEGIDVVTGHGPEIGGVAPAFPATVRQSPLKRTRKGVQGGVLDGLGVLLQLRCDP